MGDPGRSAGRRRFSVPRHAVLTARVGWVALVPMLAGASLFALDATWKVFAIGWCSAGLAAVVVHGASSDAGGRGGILDRVGHGRPTEGDGA